MCKFKQKVLFIFTIIFTLCIILPPSFGKYNINNENSNIPLTFEVIDEDAKTERVLKIPFHFNKEELLFNETKDGLEVSMLKCKSMKIPNFPTLPYYEKEIYLSRTEILTYIKVESVKTSTISLPKNTHLKLAKKPKPIISRDLSKTDDLNVKDFYHHDFSQNNVLSDQFIAQGEKLSSIFPSRNFDYVITLCEGKKKLSLYVSPVHYINGDLVFTSYLLLKIGFARKDIKTLDESKEKNRKLSVILTPDEFTEEANLLKDTQENSGYKVTITTLSQISKFKEAEDPSIRGVKGYIDPSLGGRSILKSYDYSLAKKIVTYLRDLLKEDKINYLTILGDGSKIPPSYYVFSPDCLSDYDKWVPTDIRYFAPNLKGRDFPVEISVGRLPVRDKEEAKIIVGKIARYRKAFSTEWFKNVSLISGGSTSNDFKDEILLTDLVNNDYFEGMNVYKYFKTADKYKKKDILNCFENEKTGFICEIGSGGGDKINFDKEFLDSKEIIALNDKAELPIFISSASGIGAYDTLVLETNYSTNKDLKYPTSFEEALLLSEGGAIACVGGSRVNYSTSSKRIISNNRGIPTINRKYLWFTEALIDYFFNFYHEENNNLGDIVKKTLTKYASEQFGYLEDKWYDMVYPDIKSFFGFTLLGDPTIEPPLFKGDSKSELPEIVPSNISNYIENTPLLSLDDKIEISVSTNSPELKYVLFDYEDISSSPLMIGKFEKKMNKFYLNLKGLNKSKYALRVETVDFKETRLIFYTRYQHDLSLTENFDLTRFRPGESKDFVAILQNDGLSDETNIAVTVKVNDEEVKKVNFKKVSPGSSNFVQYKLLTKEKGDYKLTITASSKSGVKFSNNILSKDITVSYNNIVRIGVLTESYLLPDYYVDAELNIKKLNERFKSESLPVEIFPISFAKDPYNNKTILQKLKIDMLILYTHNFFDYSINAYLSEIEEFQKDGGIVLGMSCLGENDYGFSLREAQSFFGISRDEEFEIKDIRETDKIMKISSEGLAFFDRKEFNISSESSVVPKGGKNWNDVILNGGKLIGLSDDGKLSLIKYGERLFYSGLITWNDLNTSEETYNFFKNLVNLAIKPRTNISISKAYVEPAIGKKNSKTTLKIGIKNCGNVSLNSIELVVNPVNKVLNFEKLEPKEEKEIDLEFKLGDEETKKEIVIIVDPSNKIDEFNEEDNKKVIKYYVADEDKPNVDLISNSKVLIDTSNPPGEVLFPSCFDWYDNELYVSTYRGICVLDEDLKFKRIINYPSFLEESCDLCLLKALSSTYSRSFLKVSEKYMIFNTLYSIFVFDKNTGELKNLIDRDYYGTLLEPLRKFNFAYDVEVYENKLFIAENYKIIVIDISSGEILSKFPINIDPVDICIQNEKLYVGGYADSGVLIMDLDGKSLKNVKIKDNYMLLSLEVSKDGFIYVNAHNYYGCLSGECNVSYVFVTNEIDNKKIREFKLSFSIGNFLSRMTILDDTIYAIGVSIYDDSPSYLFDEKLVKLDKEFKLLDEIGSYKKAKSNNKFIINPEYVCITEEGDFIFSQCSPLNMEYFRFYPKKGPVSFFSIPPPSYGLRRISLNLQDSRVGVLFRGWTSHLQDSYGYHVTILQFDSNEIPKIKSFKLKPSTKYYYFLGLSFSEKIIVSFDAYNGEIVEFSSITGEEKRRFNLCGDGKIESIYFPDSINIKDDKIWICDFTKKIIRVYSLEGDYIDEIDFSCYLGNRIVNHSGFQVIDNERFAILDSINSNLLLFNSNNLEDLIGNKKKFSSSEIENVTKDFESFYMPYSFYIKENSLIINDLGNCRVIVRPIS